MEIKTIQIDSDTFLVFKGIEYRQINVEDIVSLEVLDKYVLIVTKDCRKFVIGCSLTAILKKLCIEYIIVTFVIVEIQRSNIYKTRRLSRDSLLYTKY